ncbi:hypothetical protein CDL12_19007 [Handroanthus impetiginosus]|uniref:Uncharacterized protein n=1 Tax=Handroanthus impetiginosus TaxID=429701 RepID=A0A2G9GT17_9LAMI|nr:hypothetical protein CDL12_19007 [Handroanthus impetiginosus]
MEVSVVSDAISSIAYSAQSSGFSNFLLNYPHSVLSVSDKSSDQPSQSSPSVLISASSRLSTRTLTKRRLRKTRRVKRKIGFDNEGGGDEFFVFSVGGDVNSGGGYLGSGGGGKGWNFGGYGGWNWEEFSDNSISDPAFDIVYEILCWIAMSNCLHFAFKKVVRFVAEGVADRAKVQMPLTPVC